MSIAVSINRSSLKVALATLCSRILGMGRDIVVAHIFGATAQLDVFFAAFKIPNFLRRLFAEGAFAQGLVPALTHATDPKALFQSLWAGIIVLAGLLTIVAEIWAPTWVHVIAPGFVHMPSQFELTVHLFRIMFPFLLLVLVCALFSAALNVKYCFGWPALAPIWLNVATLAAAIWLTPYFAIPITALGWGIFLGGILQVIFLLPILQHCGWPLWPGLKASTRQVGQVMANTAPGVIGVSIGQMGLVVDVILASYLPAGSISWLFYSDRLVSLPLGLIGVAISSALLPYLAKADVQAASHDYQASLKNGIKLVLLLGLPAAVGLFMLAQPITATVYESGHFSLYDVSQAQASLAAFALGLPGMMLIKVLASAMNARQQFKMPCVFALLSVVVNIISGWWLMQHYHHVGLALATSAAIWINAICLIAYNLKHFIGPNSKASIIYCVRLLLALSAMIYWLHWFSPPFAQWAYWHYAIRWTHLVEIISSAIAIYSIVFVISHWPFKTCSLD